MSCRPKPKKRKESTKILESAIRGLTVEIEKYRIELEKLCFERLEIKKEIERRKG